MKKILCPVDFSSASLNALEFAVGIGEHEKSCITLVNIFTPSDFNKILEKQHVKEEYEILLNIAESKLKAMAEEIELLSGSKLAECNYLLKSGETTEQLAEIVKEGGYDLIVTGMTGHSAEKRKYLAGKAQTIIREMGCSVLCVPEDYSYKGIKKLVYATDYQEEDKLAIQQITTLAEHLGATVTFLHVSHHNDSIDKAMFEEFKRELTKFIDDKPVAFERVVFHNVAEGLTRYMKEQSADLLILLNKKLNFMQSLFHRRLTDQLDKFASHPLLTLKL
jgi:nucleotide-binding universal stress UspA family protein